MWCSLTPSAFPGEYIALPLLISASLSSQTAPYLLFMKFGCALLFYGLKYKLTICPIFFLIFFSSSDGVRCSDLFITLHCSG